jgi:pimeloyl-ACP methyl ester carboxylesterase
MLKFMSLAFGMLILAGCGGGESGGSTPSTPTFSLQCDLTLNYTPIATPITDLGVGTPDTTVIALHGKSGNPAASHMNNLAGDLTAAGYDVVRPYLPWTSSSWNGSLCDAMAYINSLIEAEKTAGKSVILLSHSLAGIISMSYMALDNTSKPAAITIVAPGHFIHQSSTLASSHASSIALAKDMIANDQADTIATFVTRNNGSNTNISTTPTIYLSFHDTSELPDAKASLPLITQPILWLAGTSDNLTDLTKNTFGITASIPSTPAANTYKEINGDHLSVMGYVTDELDPWYQNL